MFTTHIPSILSSLTYAYVFVITTTTFFYFPHCAICLTNHTFEDWLLASASSATKVIPSRPTPTTTTLAQSSEETSTSYEAVVVSILYDNPELSYRSKLVQAAVEFAVVRVSNLYRPRLKFRTVFAESNRTCDESLAGGFAAEEFYLRKASAFVGPGCSSALDQVARMAAFWNVPVFTAGGIGENFSNKKVFSTLTRLSFSLDRVSQFLLKVLKDFQWRHIAIFVDESFQRERLMAQSVEEATFRATLQNLQNNTQRFEIHRYYFRSNTTTSFAPLLKTAASKARVFLLICSADTLRRVLLDAFDENMGNGEFAFLSIELIREEKQDGNSSAGSRYGNWYRSKDVRNKDVKKMFESLMVVAVRVPTSEEFKSFTQHVAAQSAAKLGIDVYENSVNTLVAAFYDCVLLYAWCLNRTLSDGKDPRDGRNLIRYLWNSTFQEGLTGNIFININGDRETDFTLNDFNPESGLMMPVAGYFGSSQLYERIKNSYIHWPLGHPPPDVPYCGFLGDAPHCKDVEYFPAWASAIFISIFILIIGAVVGMLFIRKISLESQLSDTWWRVRWEDVTLLDVKPSMSLGSVHVRTGEDGGTVSKTVKFHGKRGPADEFLLCDRSFRQTSTSSHRSTNASSSNVSTLDGAHVSGWKVANYKGVKIAIKPLNIKKLNINREILIDLRQMRDLTHENLVRFVGLCPDSPNVALLFELCHRGTLQDMLQNESIKIDWIFKCSMLTDIVEGLAFIQDSAIEVHGRLTSASIVIDGRFVVKLADYGLRTIYDEVLDEEEAQTQSNERNPRSLFWCAPEHLRELHPLKHGSKKGDVYSFAIVLKELLTRTGPYDEGFISNFLEPEDILARLRRGNKPYFRPEVSSESGPAELLALIRRCWSENPDERPTFSEIKNQVKSITNGVSSRNIMDNLLNRMEQYANNLEAMVEKKTQSLIDEKKKTEELLYRLLPRYVADELKRGRPVMPETFESVTIFFSDIVGFTVISAQATPIQVVDLLNDLYTCFDSIIENYNVYKVETIGDAYMVVSGLPVRNGREHAREIARMALDIRKAISYFKMRHQVDHKMQVRIGIHSGPCAAGVVGLKTPRYCLFGDTVNTASRMESNGQAMKIHISSDTKTILDMFGLFRIALRGDIEIKGKGTMRTYWLDGEDGKNDFFMDPHPFLHETV